MRTKHGWMIICGEYETVEQFDSGLICTFIGSSNYRLRVILSFGRDPLTSATNWMLVDLANSSSCNIQGAVWRIESSINPGGSRLWFPNTGKELYKAVTGGSMWTRYLVKEPYPTSWISKG